MFIVYILYLSLWFILIKFCHGVWDLSQGPLFLSLCVSHCSSMTFWEGYFPELNCLCSFVIWDICCQSISGFSVLFRWSLCLCPVWNWAGWLFLLYPFPNGFSYLPFRIILSNMQKKKTGWNFHRSNIKTMTIWGELTSLVWGVFQLMNMACSPFI